MGAQDRIRDDPAFPDGRQEIVLADHTFTIVKQICQEVEDLWPDRDGRSRAPKLAPFVVENAIFDRIKQDAPLEVGCRGWACPYEID